MAEPDREYPATAFGTELLCSNVEPSFSEAVNPSAQSWQTRNAALFFMKLESSHLVLLSVVQNISSEIHPMNSLGQNRRLRKIGEVIKEHQVDNEVSGKILSELSNEETPFNPVDGVLQTKYSRQDFYKRESKMIEPVEVKFKNERSFHYEPIKQSLAALLSDTTSRQALLKGNEGDRVGLLKGAQWSCSVATVPGCI